MVRVAGADELRGQDALLLAAGDCPALHGSALKVVPGVLVVGAHQAGAVVRGELLVPHHDQDLDSLLRLPLEQLPDVGGRRLVLGAVPVAHQGDLREDGPARDVDELFGSLHQSVDVPPAGRGLVGGTVRLCHILKLGKNNVLFHFLFFFLFPTHAWELRRVRVLVQDHPAVLPGREV